MVGRRTMGGVLLAAVVLGASGVVPAGAAGAPGGAVPERAGRARRVLIFVAPGLAWRDLDDHDLPTLRAVAEESGVANLSSRAPKLRTDLASAYVTLGAGNKAVGAGLVDDGTGLVPDGAAFDADEPHGSATAGEVFARRTGTAAAGGIVHLGIAPVAGANRDSAYDARIGALGDALAARGIGRAVIANGDGWDAVVPSGVGRTMHREAAAAVMGRDGTVPGGTVGRRLLALDPGKPFGVRLDPARVDEAFDAAWRGRTVVVVEASDLVRAEGYRLASTQHQRETARAAALRSADALLGMLLLRVDPAHDAVVVLGTAPDPDRAALAVAAVRAPSVRPGLLRSGTTQRAGFVQLMDVAPSVLDLLAVDRPHSMRGRPVRVADESGSGASRRAFLVDVDAATRFRARIVNPVAVVFIVLTIAVVVVTMLVLTGVTRKRSAARAAPVLAVACLTYLPSVYLARLLPLHDAGVLAYWGFLVVSTVVLATLILVVTRRRPVDTALLGLAVIGAVLLADGLLGSDLQLNSGLGFSAEVAGRFIGYGNAGYAALAAAALLGAGLLAHRVGGRRGAWCGVTVLGVALVVDGAPFWGADVGGVLSMVPAYAVAAVLLLGWRLRLRTVLLAASATAGAVVLAAFADMQRAAGQRSHLGRLVEQVRGEGVDAFVSVVDRKLAMNLASLSSSVWRLLVPIALAFLAYLAFDKTHDLAALTRRIPPLRSVLIGFAVLLVLGYALNDTGILVPAIMLAVLVAVVVILQPRGTTPMTEPLDPDRELVLLDAPDA